MRRITFTIVLALALATSAGAAADPRAGAAEVHDCHHHVDFNILISSARNISCAKARREMRRYRGSIRYRFTTPGGFRCRRVSGNRLGGQWRCVRGRRAFRFEFGD